LKFRDFENKLRQTVFASPTPAEYEKGKADNVVEQVVRPTGLVDPQIIVRPARTQVDDLMGEINDRIAKDEREGPASSIAVIILGLQAFMLAFTFSIVSERYDTKKALVREEAGVIRTAFHRSDLLQEPARTRSKTLLQQYVDHRLDVVAQNDIEVAKMSLADAVKTQRELWDIAVTNARIDMNSDIGALYVESINEIAEVHANRVALGLQSRIPTTIWAVLWGLMILGMFGVGYHAAIADSRRPHVTPILAIAFSLVVMLIASLDRPGGRLMPVPQTPLENVQAEMRAAPVQAQ